MFIHIKFMHRTLPYKRLSFLKFLFPKNNPLTRSCVFSIQMEAPAFAPHSSTFLESWGTPALLWEVLQFVGYLEAPRYTWNDVVPMGEMPWYNVVVDIPPHPTKPLWRGWLMESGGNTPWEGARAVPWMCSWISLGMLVMSWQVDRLPFFPVFISLILKGSRKIMRP
jgi:hypothetical protein